MPLGGAFEVATPNDGGMTILKRFLAPALSWQTARDAFYLLIGLIYGLLWGCLIITLYSVGFGTVVIWIGVPILLLTQVLLRGIGVYERMLINGLLGEDIPEPEPLASVGPASDGKAAGFFAWAGTVWRDRHAWRVLSWVTWRFVVCSIGFSLAVTYFVLPPSILASPFVPWAWIPDDVNLSQGGEWFWLGPILGIILFPFLAWAIKGLGDAHRRMGRWALGPVES